MRPLAVVLTVALLHVLLFVLVGAPQPPPLPSPCDAEPCSVLELPIRFENDICVCNGTSLCDRLEALEAGAPAPPPPPSIESSCDDCSPTNELQNISLSGPTVSISSGNSITLPLSSITTYSAVSANTLKCTGVGETLISVFADCFGLLGAVKYTRYTSSTEAGAMCELGNPATLTIVCIS